VGCPAVTWRAGRVCTTLFHTNPNITTTPHVRGRGDTPRGSSANQPPVVFRPYPHPPWVGGAGSGRVPDPSQFAAHESPLGPPPMPHAGFLSHWEGQKYVGFYPLDIIRWVVPKVGGAWYTP
jgi:hypothetical protein